MPFGATFLGASQSTHFQKSLTTLDFRAATFTNNLVKVALVIRWESTRKELMPMAFFETVKSALWGIVQNMSKTTWRFAKNPDRDFKRRRKMDFENLVRMVISMEGGTVKHELLKYFDYDPNTMTPSAFYQQRCKLHPDTFPYLFKQFLACYPGNLYRAKYRLLASDGSELYIPRNTEDTESYHPPSGMSERGFNLVHVTALYDLCNRTYQDAIIQPCRLKNEFRALCDLIDRHDPGIGIPFFIADRGCASYNVFAHALEKNAFFLIRAKDINVKRFLAIKQLPDSLDTTADLILTRSQAKKKRKQPNLALRYRYIPYNVDFDYITHASGDEYPLALRIVRFQLAVDSFVNVVTNLPSSDFPAEEIKILYRLRWGIEGAFRELKYAIGAVNFHSINRELINQEIWARLILYNFCSIITAHVVIRKKPTKHSYKVNYSMAIKICHHFLRIPFGRDPPDIHSLISSSILPIRLGRSFHRHNRIRRPPSFLYRFS